MAQYVRTQINQNLNRLVRQPGGDSGSINAEGLLVATVKYLCAWDKVFRLLPRRYVSRHPDYNGLVANEVSFTRKPPGIAEITCKYAGVPSGDATGPTGTGAFLPVEEVSVSVSQEPIETSPNFGSISSSEKTYNTNSDGKEIFSGFKKDSDFEGIDSYLAPQATFRRSYISETIPSLSGIGTRNTPTNAPTTASGFNWLKSGITASKQGELWSVSEEWLLSASSDGWNTTIYN